VSCGQGCPRGLLLAGGPQECKLSHGSLILPDKPGALSPATQAPVSLIAPYHARHARLT